MLINLGRLLMLIIWVFLLLNIIMPVQKPLNYFLYFALIFMTIMHLLKVFMISFMLAKSEPLTFAQKIRLFLFGVFEMIPMYRRQKAALSETNTSQVKSSYTET
ncbi:DUF1145 domain-containing protein [Thorsellia anophelis]|uniref:Putative membrane protein n=1 Tax=Thorsellia anophelis DSM 18579 TaxID=1123402 RepID=A0A1H9YSQ7_9GAMM|nr:DUF1145 domain-containing protein [Thorsellia anophelis]SES72199.1 putative membrane protein [Thorsellia anophelis DSM 18579]